MGNNSSRSAKPTKQQKQEFTKSCEQVKAKIRSEWNENDKRTLGNQVVSPAEAFQILTITHTVNQQLSRNGKPLTKADLIAIVIKFQMLNGQPCDLQQMNSYTVEQLNDLIRCIIYDPSTFITPQQHSVVSLPSTSTNTNTKQSVLSLPSTNTKHSVLSLPSTNTKQSVLSLPSTNTNTHVSTTTAKHSVTSIVLY